MRKIPRISVVIPSYNKVKYVGKTLSSIFEQKYPNLEVIIQDGSSTDGTIEVIKRYQKKYKGIIYESKKDGGQLNAVNKGLKKASGEILTFINADDYYFPNTFGNIAEAYLKNRDALWFAGRGIVVNDENNEIARPVTFYKDIMLNANIYSFLLTTNYLIQPSVFFTKKAYDIYGPFTGTINFITEYALWLKFGSIKMPIILNRPLSHFRIEPSTKTKLMFKELLKEDERIVGLHTKNKVILLLHSANNIGRKIVGRFV